MLFRDFVALEMNCKGKGELSLSITEAELTLAECTLLLVRFQEGALPWQEDLMVSHIDGLEGGDHSRIGIEGPVDDPPPNDNNKDDDPENTKFDDKARRDRLEALRARHLADGKSRWCIMELHKGIIAEMEMLKRRMDDLVEKQNNIVEKLEECRDFLIKATYCNDTMPGRAWH